MFTGTIRSNLDPLSEHTDTELWTVVRRVHLDHAVDSSSMGLDMPLREGGAPLSAGQRQLLTLARALLKKSKVNSRLAVCQNGKNAPGSRYLLDCLGFC